MSEPTSDFITSVAEYLAANGIGSVDARPASVQVGVLGATPDNATAVIGTTGLMPEAYIPEFQYPHFQTLTRSTDYNAGAQKTRAIRDLLHGKFGITIGEYHALYVWADQDVQPMGQDTQGRHMFSINYRAQIRDASD